jgi:hypothetical protein
MPAHHSYHRPEYLARQRAASMGNTHGNDAMRRYAAQRVIQWTTEMRSALLAHYVAGRPVEFLAIDIGVARSVVLKEMNRLALPRGRWVTRATRCAAAAAAVRRIAS